MKIEANIPRCLSVFQPGRWADPPAEHRQRHAGRPEVKMSSVVLNVSSVHTQAFSITLLLMCLPSTLCGILHYNSINVPSFHTLALSITSFLVCLSSSLWHSPFHCFYQVRPLWRSLLHHCEHVFCPHSSFLQDIVIVSSIRFSVIHCYIGINISSILTPASPLHH